MKPITSTLTITWGPRLLEIRRNDRPPSNYTHVVEILIVGLYPVGRDKDK